ncbi:P-loop NTPase fold protein [Nitrosopumilus sp.]|uniref:P-loop NTPase fold protein n=1 Tax=Nitrosopumilus sp. TaxID=2024843 RepID=UPI00247E83AD|nr:P-loop NTPase fold protein [Nitrosopumilus sp.]MCV0410701.1 KAP family NTPase [Nitrosopumilus sp.]
MMKLFLDVENTVFIAAVDFKRLQHAWYKKYGIDPNTQKEGRDYLEKIFQVRIAIPVPSQALIVDFTKTIVPNMPQILLHMMSRFGPTNPRGIKRMLNNVSYRSLLLSSKHSEISAILWTLLEEILSIDQAVHFHRIIKKNLNGLSFYTQVRGDSNTMYGELKRFSSKFSYQEPEATTLTEFVTLVDNLPGELKISLDSIETDFDILCSETNETMR